MKSPIRLTVFFLIILGGFWAGMHWGSSARNSSRSTINPIIPLTPQPTRVIPIIVPAETMPVTEDVTGVEEIVTAPVKTETSPTVVANTSVDANLPSKTTDKVNQYSNSNFRYGFDIPANVYYSGFGAEAGARHTVGISKEDPETLALSAVRVYFYGKKIVPELQNISSGKYIDPAGKYIYLLLDGAYSVKIEAVNINHPIVQKIIETIKVF